MSKKHLINSVYMVLFLSVTSTSAEIYKWVDQDGQVRYSDKNPNDIEFANLVHKIKEKQERSKDEIQRVFDRHKGKIYRLYLMRKKMTQTLSAWLIILSKSNSVVRSKVLLWLTLP